MVRHQQLDHTFAHILDRGRIRDHLQSGLYRAYARSRIRSRARIHHAEAARSYRRFILLMAQRRNWDVVHSRRVEDGGPGGHDDLFAVDGQRNGRILLHQFLKQTSPTQRRCCKCSSICSGKCLITESTGTGAICPRPHIEAVLSTSESSLSSGIWSGENFPCVQAVIMSTIFCVPTRHGTHLPQLSLRKNRIAFNAMSSMHVPSAQAITALDPTMDPAFESAPHSIGVSAILAGR